MRVPWQAVLAWAVLNAATFAVYGADKHRARRERWRIPERTLLLLAALGGSLGALLGMNVFHHKTRKPLFRILVPLFVLAHLLAAAWLARRGGMVLLW